MLNVVPTPASRKPPKPPAAPGAVPADDDVDDAAATPNPKNKIKYLRGLGPERLGQASRTADLWRLRTAQERTIEEARESLKEVIALILETRSGESQAQNVIAREPITVDV